MDLSIIIVTWKSVDFLRLCIRSIYRETRGITYEILVVDNASEDNSKDIIHREFPDVRFFQSDVNLGFAKANNLGFHHARADLILFLNPDTEIHANALATMIAALRDGDDNVAAAGPRLLNSDGSLQTSCVQAYPTLLNQTLDSEILRERFPHWKMWGNRVLFRTDTRPAPVDAVSGACLLVRRNVFREVGLFTSDFFMYAEDLDLSYKITKAGYSILYVPRAIVTHHGGGSSSQCGDTFADIRQKCAVLQFLQLRRGRFYAMGYRIALACSALVRLVLVIASAALGRQLSTRDRFSSAVVRRWTANLRWALGLKQTTNPTLE